jgi:hypothetical protein
MALELSEAEPAPAPPAPALPAASPVAIDERLLAPTVRAPRSYAAPERTNGWQRVISVLSTLEQLSTPGIKAA